MIICFLFFCGLYILDENIAMENSENPYKFVERNDLTPLDVINFSDEEFKKILPEELLIGAKYYSERNFIMARQILENFYTAQKYSFDSEKLFTALERFYDLSNILANNRRKSGKFSLNFTAADHIYYEFLEVFVLASSPNDIIDLVNHLK